MKIVSMILLLALVMACQVESSRAADSQTGFEHQQSASWFAGLSEETKASVLWLGDVEEGTLYDWNFDDFQHAGGGVFNTGGDQVIARVTDAIAHSGRYAVETGISRAIRSRNGDRAVRLMRWTNTAWDNGGEYFPLDTYFSVWMNFPNGYNPNKYDPWDPGDGGWWNVFQFKSDDETGESQPIWVLNIDHNDATNEMYFYLYSKHNLPRSYGQTRTVAIPVGQWVHIEAHYVQSSDARGSITIWQDGQRILSVEDVITKLAEPIHWGIGNYTDHIAGGVVEGSATIFFDDAAVSTLRLYP